MEKQMENEMDTGIAPVILNPKPLDPKYETLTLNPIKPGSPKAP